MGKVRAFVAIKIGDDLAKTLDRLLAELREEERGVKWVHAENLHITLKFLGNVEESALPALQKALEQAARKTAPFYLKATGLEALPNHRYPRVIFADLKGETDRLAAAARAVEAALEPLGFAPEKRDFLPHLTLGRVKSFRTKTLLMNKLREYHNREFGALNADRIYLMKSELNPAGAIYTELADFTLREES